MPESEAGTCYPPIWGVNEGREDVRVARLSKEHTEFQRNNKHWFSVIIHNVPPSMEAGTHMSPPL